MGSRIVRALACICLLFVLSACEMTAQLTTTLNGDGSGTFTLAIGIDRELRGVLQAATDQGLTETSGIEDLEALFGGLATDGWSIARSEPDGGLRLEARKAFEDKEAFDALLGDVRTARTGEGTGFDDIRFELGYQTSSSFLREGVTFFGLIDTSQDGLTPREQAVQDAIARDLRFEIRTELPGSVSTTSGNGTVSGGTVVWRPTFGNTMTFSAEASSLRIGSLMMVLLPGLALLGAIGWFALGRRRPEETADDAEAPSWTDELVAIKPDPVPAPLDPQPVAPVLEPEPARTIDLTPAEPAVIEPVAMDVAPTAGIVQPTVVHMNGSTQPTTAPVDPQA